MTAVASCSVVQSATGQKNDSSPETYYISPSGNDSASGTTPSTAWRTLDKADATVFPPGSSILFQGGDKFTGELKLSKDDAGNASKPVTIGSYGKGVATIHASGTSGIIVFDTAGVDIRDLKITGSGATGSGINAYSNLPTGKRLNHISIQNVQVNGFKHGISIGGLNAAAGFSDVQINDSTIYGNMDSGLMIFGPAFNAKSPSYANRNVSISHVVSQHNTGDPANTVSNTGSGIVLGSVSGGSVTWSTATGNGGKGNAPREGVGIWAYDSTDITFAHDLSYKNKTVNQVDGGGFDFDENTSNSIMEDNLSYENDGAGYLVYSSLNNGAEKNNIIRNNISSGDVVDGSWGYYSAITINGDVSDLAVYQNTVVSEGSAAALALGPGIHRVTVANNIFSTESAAVLKVKDSLPQGSATFLGNDYYATGTWELRWGKQTYWSLSEWQAETSQETRNGQSTGHDLAPLLAGPTLDLAAKSPADMTAARGFELTPRSSLSGAGLDLRTLGLQVSTTDFLGQAQSIKHPNIGAL